LLFKALKYDSFHTKVFSEHKMYTSEYLGRERQFFKIHPKDPFPIKQL